MISAQNHQLPLSGNKIVVYLLLLCSLTYTSCTKKAYSSSPSTKVDVKRNDTGLNENNTTKPKVDTIIWTKESDTKPPITVIQKDKVVRNTTMEFKDRYNIKLLVPLKAGYLSSSDITNSRFVHFYAGVLKALEILDDEQIKLNIEVFDTEDKSTSIKEKVSSIVNNRTDLIIGPFEREDVKIFAEACKEATIPIVSPWYTSSKVTNDNPYYVQMKPNLREHFIMLTKSAISEFQKGEVTIIGKDNIETNSWMTYFQDLAKDKGSSGFFGKQFVTEESLNQGVPVFEGLIKSGCKAVIIPNYSYNDENFVYLCLRRLMTDKGNRNIVVYGMPILYDSEKIDFEFYHSLNMRIVMSDFVDEQQSSISDFRREYLDLYGEVPMSDAIKGYDIMLYIGRNIWKYGKNFQHYLDTESSSYLQSTYNVVKAKSEDSPTLSDPSKFDFFENKHLDIIEFKGTKFKVRN
jgi:Receptor family ligand binding region